MESPVFEKGYPDYDAVNRDDKSTQPLETELMAITAEECGELTQACMKIVRWGINKKKTAGLIEEAGDVALMLDLLVDHGYVTKEEIDARKEVKRLKLKRYSNLIKE
jgi:NTP pyrophosphatase (non-canonical NTP hydrolase)